MNLRPFKLYNNCFIILDKNEHQESLLRFQNNVFDVIKWQNEINKGSLWKVWLSELKL